MLVWDGIHRFNSGSQRVTKDVDVALLSTLSPHCVTPLCYPIEVTQCVAGYTRNLLPR